MNTQISSKFAALAVALMMNSLIIGGVACLFNGPLHPRSAVVGQFQSSVQVPRVGI